MFMSMLPPELVSGGGIMGELIRTREWEGTDVGPLLHWPPNLLNTVSVMLSSRLPSPYPILISLQYSTIVHYNIASHKDTEARNMHRHAASRSITQHHATSRNITQHHAASRSITQRHKSSHIVSCCIIVSHCVACFYVVLTLPVRFPMILYWGARQEIIYNDAYIPVSFKDGG